MRVEAFIARRFNKHTGRDGQEMSRPAIKVAIIGVALGLAVMLISIAVIVGFKREVRSQVIGFGSHIQIASYENYGNMQESPMRQTADFRKSLLMLDNVSDVQNIVRKPGIIQTDRAFQGVMMKGVDSTYNWDFFCDRLVAGDVENVDSIDNWTVISRIMADNMDLDTGMTFIVYFVGENLRARKYRVAAIYQTTFSEYDKLYILTDLRGLQQLNNWNADQYSSLELLLKDWEKLDETAGKVFGVAADEGELYSIDTIVDMAPQIFDWLSMLDMNAVIILVLMMLVSGFCIISGLLILILERCSTIGLLKALGMTDWGIRMVFLRQALYLVGEGMIWGNIVGLALILIQYFTSVVPLDPASYYVDHVPVFLSVKWWILLNIGMGLTATAMLVLPSRMIVKVKPSELIDCNAQS